MQEFKLISSKKIANTVIKCANKLKVTEWKVFRKSEICCNKKTSFKSKPKFFKIKFRTTQNILKTHMIYS